MCYSHQYPLFKPQDKTHFIAPRTLPRQEGRFAAKVSTILGQSHQDSCEAPCSTTWPGSSEACNQEGSVINEANSSRRGMGREGEKTEGEGRGGGKRGEGGPERWEDFPKVTLQARVRPHYEEPPRWCWKEKMSVSACENSSCLLESHIYWELTVCSTL